MKPHGLFDPRQNIHAPFPAAAPRAFRLAPRLKSWNASHNAASLKRGRVHQGINIAVVSCGLYACYLESDDGRRERAKLFRSKHEVSLSPALSYMDDQFNCYVNYRGHKRTIGINTTIYAIIVVLY
jgi:hypothetical protein